MMIMTKMIDYYDDDNDVKESSLVFWVILEYRSTHNGGGKATLLRDQGDGEVVIAIQWIGKISVRSVSTLKEKDHHLSPFRLKQVLCCLHVSIDVLCS